MLYYGKGKGKTTAAVGLAVRAAGSGLNVFFLQFVKGEWPCGERDFFQAIADLQKKYRLVSPKRSENGGNVPGTFPKKVPGTITSMAVGRGFVKILGDKKPFAVHKKAAEDGLRAAHHAMRSKKYQLIVLDEAVSAYESKLLKLSDLVTLCKEKKPDIHLVLTGHVAPKQLVAQADLVSEINMIKHPYYQGVLAQRGIDY